MTPTRPSTRGCGWCGKPGHGEAEHPLPKDHPQYDPFFDASDAELARLVGEALHRQGWDTRG